MRGSAVSVKNNLSFLCHLSGFAMTACIMGKWAISKNYVMAGMFGKNLSYALLHTFKTLRLNSYSAWRQVSTVPIYYHTLHFHQIPFIPKLGVCFLLLVWPSISIVSQIMLSLTRFCCSIILKCLLIIESLFKVCCEGSMPKAIVTSMCRKLATVIG